MTCTDGTVKEPVHRSKLVGSSQATPTETA